jgi:hypothetical protein
MKNNIPKKIWILWLQGWENAPEIVKECRKSWEKLNPDWEVVALDNITLSQYIDSEEYLNNPKIPPQALSDIIRILLLKKHGGVWADASVFCSKPLNEWVYDHTPRGFFAFSKPGPYYDKLTSSWFLVSEKNNIVISEWLMETKLFWSKGPVAPATITKTYHKLSHILIMLRQSWVLKKSQFFLKKSLGLFPYFWFHYIFDKLYARNKEVKKIWDYTPHISADGPHKLIFYGLEKDPTKEILSFINSNESFVHKLSWRTDITREDLKNSSVNILIDTTKNKYSFY